CKNPHQVIFQREIKTCYPRIALTPCAAAQLVVDTPRFMALGTDNMQTTGFKNHVVTFFPLGFTFLDFLWRRVFQFGDFCLPVTAEYNVSTATGHVSGDGYCTRHTRLSNNFCFLLMIFSIEYAMLNTRFIQAAGHFF